MEFTQIMGVTAIVVIALLQSMVIFGIIDLFKLNKLKDRLVETEADIKTAIYSDDTDSVWVETEYKVGYDTYEKNLFARTCDIHDNKIKVWVDTNNPKVVIAEADDYNIMTYCIVAEVICISLIMILVAFKLFL